MVHLEVEKDDLVRFDRIFKNIKFLEFFMLEIKKLFTKTDKLL